MSLSRKFLYDLTATNLTVGNINFTGSLYQNGSLYSGGGGGGGSGNVLANQVNLGASSLFSGSFTASNNTTVASNVTGLSFSNADTRSFSALVSVSITRTAAANLYETYTLEGYQGDSGWNIYYTSLGDNTQIVFTITSSGQIQYTCPNYGTVTAFTMRFSVTQISKTSNYASSGTAGTYLLDDLQITNNITVGTLLGTTVRATTITGGSISVSGDIKAAGSMTVANLAVPGTLTVVNITSTNLVDTTISAGTLVGSSVSVGSLIGTNMSTGNIYLSGSIYQSDGSLFVSGGGNGGVTLGNFLTNQLYMGVSGMFSGSFTAANNTAVASDITGLAFSNAGTRSFTALVSVSVVRTGATSLYETYTLDGYQNDSGWVIGYRSVGDDTNIVFTITSSGQVRYTCPNYAGSITSFTMRYSVTQIAKSGDYTPTGTSGTYFIDELKVNGTISTGNIYFTGNLYRNGQIYTSATSVTTGDLLVAGTLTGANLAMSTGTIANLLATTGTLGSLVATNVNATALTAGSLVATNVNATALTAGSLVATNANATALTTGALTATVVTAGNLVATAITASNLAVPGTLTVVNITSTNLVDTNITASSLLAANSTLTNTTAQNLLVSGGSFRATHNSNTVGSIFTTGGNVGIGTTSPVSALEMRNGVMGITSTNGTTMTLTSINGAFASIEAYTSGNIFTKLPLCLNPWGGNVGVGTTSPLSPLTVNGDIFINTVGSLWISSNSDSGTNRFRFHHAGGFSYIDFNGGPFSIRSGILPSINNLLTMSTSGGVLIKGSVAASPYTVMQLQQTNHSTPWFLGPDYNNSFCIFNNLVVGMYIAYGATSWTTTSDQRIKKHITNITSGLSCITQLNPVYYHYKSDDDSAPLRQGFIAQDVKNVLPNIVSESSNEEYSDLLGLNQTEMIPYMVQAIKDLKAELDVANATIMSQQAEINAIKAHLGF